MPSSHVIRIIVTVIFVLSLIYFLKSCYDEYQKIVISNVREESIWSYDIVTPPIIGERQFVILIDGELDHNAALELQTQITTSNTIKSQNYTNSPVLKLPKGKFALFIDFDDSGPVKFIYHPLKATKGWINIEIRPGQWDIRDSTRRYPDPALNRILGGHQHSYEMFHQRRLLLIIIRLRGEVKKTFDFFTELRLSILIAFEPVFSAINSVKQSK